MQDLILEDDLVCLAQAGFCAVSGYLVLRVKTGAQSAGALTADQAARLGGHLARCTAAIEAAAGADRVYCLSFCEVDRGLHYHLFPRTPALLAAYQEATGSAGQPVNGPLLFEWARAEYPAGGTLPASFPAARAVSDRLRQLLG